MAYMLYLSTIVIRVVLVTYGIIVTLVIFGTLVPLVTLVTFVVYAVFLCYHATVCDVNSFMTDGYGIVNVRIKLATNTSA